MKKYKPNAVFTAFAAVLMICVNSASAQNLEKRTAESLSGGEQFSIEKSVIAGGGSEKQAAQINENGTIGQSVAGYRSSGGNFTLYSGFWTPEDFAPTAAVVTISGCVKTANGTGIRNASVSIRFPDGEIRTAKSGSYGFFQFTEIPAGEVYIISVSAKRFTFSQPMRVLHISGDAENINFVALERNLEINTIQP